MPLDFEFQTQELLNRCFEAANNRLRRVNQTVTPASFAFQTQEILNRVFQVNPAGMTLNRLDFSGV